MLDKLALKLRRARSTRPIFGDRVVCVADTSRAIEYTAMAYPAAYVLFLGETTEAQAPGANAYRQRVVESWGIVVGLDATMDARGQNPTQRIDYIRRQLCLALYNWTPDKDHGALFYDSCALLAVNRATTFWTFSFGSYGWICEDDGEAEEQFEPLPDFEGIDHAYVDFIDPHDRGEPPSQQYTPPIGPSRGPPPWPVGPEGRIELQFNVDVPTPSPRKRNGK